MICSRCHQQPARLGQRVCKRCHAAYMRDWRKSNRLQGGARIRANARSYAHEYVKTGKIEKQPCCICGNEKAEMHHPDHSKPLHVFWVCRKHHLAWHEIEKLDIGLEFEDWAGTAAVSCETDEFDEEYIYLSSAVASLEGRAA